MGRIMLSWRAVHADYDSIKHRDGRHTTYYIRCVLLFGSHSTKNGWNNQGLLPKCTDIKTFVSFMTLFIIAFLTSKHNTTKERILSQIAIKRFNHSGAMVAVASG